MESITQAIMDRMFEQNVSISELGRRIGMHRSSVAKYLHSPESMPLGALKKMVEALNMDWDWFWTQEVFWDA